MGRGATMVLVLASALGLASRASATTESYTGITSLLGTSITWGDFTYSCNGSFGSGYAQTSTASPGRPPGIQFGASISGATATASIGLKSGGSYTAFTVTSISASSYYNGGTVATKHTLTGYKNGLPVPGASQQITTVEAITGTPITLNSSFAGLDAIAIAPDNGEMALQIYSITYTGITDNTPPTVSSIARFDSATTNAANLRYTVTFSEAVTGVTSDDFTVTASGVTGASVTSVTGSGATYSVTVGTGSGDGTLRLDLKSSGTGIADAFSNAITTGFTSGEVYTLDRTAPTASIGAPSAAAATTGPVSFTITYADTNFSSANLFNSNITVNKTGTADCAISTSGSGNTRTVTLLNLTGDGTLGISLAAGTASDTAGNLAPAAGPSATFQVVNTKPAISNTSGPASTYGATIASYPISATGSPSSYGASGLPAGLNVDANSGSITGMPTVSGNFSVTLSATNLAGTGNATLTFTVERAALTVTAQPANRLYGATNPSFSATVSGFVNGDTSAVVSGTASLTSPATATTPAGNADIIPTVGTLTAANYKFTNFVKGVLAINPVPLTVTADPASRAFGEGNPPFTVSFTGFVNGETAANAGISGAASFTTNALPLSPVGNYTVTPAIGSLTSTNYSFTSFTEGTLIVTKAALTVLGVLADNKTYDGSLTATLDFSGAALNGVALGDEANVAIDSSAATAVFSSKTAVSDKAVTVSGVKLSGPSAANYTVAQPTGVKGNIFKRTVIVSGVTASNKVYDGNATATFSTTAATLSGIVSGDVATLDRSVASGIFQATKIKSGPQIAALKIGGDTDVFALDAGDPTVGVGKTVVISGLTLAGLDKDNYSVASPSGVTASITPKALTVAGTTASDKVYNGTTPATLGFGSATLVGVVSPDVVTLVSSAATGTFANANVGLNKTVTVAGLTLGGAAAANYTVTQPTTTASITPANASVSISGLSQVYDGTPKSATITITPNAAASIVYSNTASGTPINAGNYTVSVNITDANYSGGTTARFVIAKAPQTVAFAALSGTPTINVPLTLSATASSTLPVTYSLVSGPASLNGATLTLTSSGAVTVRATQAGGDNYLPATADLTLAAGGKLPQTVSFAALSNRRSTDAAFTLNASASSGLPVTFTVTGPATFNSATRTLTLTGAAGAVTVVASQAGNGTFAAAPDVTRSFNVLATGQQTFFGLTSNRDTVGVSISADGKSGTLICYLGATGEAFVVDFVVNSDGTFDATVTALNAAELEELLLASDGFGARAAATGSRTFTGKLDGGSISGSILELGVSFSAAVQPASGSSAGVSGVYKAPSTGGAAGGTYSIVGTQGQVFAIAVTPTSVVAGTGTVSASNTFSIQSGNSTIAAAIDAATTAVTGTVSVSGQQVQTFAGTNISSVRTDRLVNLSSRVRIAPAAGRTLITGFVIGGTESKRLLLRAVGPSLTNFGVTGALVNPKLQLFDASGKVLLENDDWTGTDTAAAFAQVGAFGLTAGTKDAAILTTLAPGAYSMQVTAGTESGTGLAEIYDASATASTDTQRLVNISTRGTVDVGTDGLLIGGFVVTGNAPKKVLIRGVGPGLTAFGVAGALVDPRIAVYSGSTLIAQNDDWSVAQPVNALQTVATAAEVTNAAVSAGSFALNAGTKDAAVLVTLAPGAYTAQVTGAAGQTGVALVEIYEVP